MINQINVGIIGTGWCGGIRANACADNPLVDKLYIAESNKERLQELKKSLKLESSTDNWNELIDNKKHVNVTLIGAGKFGSMFLSQAPYTLSLIHI